MRALTSHSENIDITATAIAGQKLDSFTGNGWTKIVAPAKVNLHLAVGQRRPDGYHEVTSVLHSLSLHDVVYMRREQGTPGQGLSIELEMLARGGLELPKISPQDNLAYKAIDAFARALGRTEDETIKIRIEKNIPSQAGLGGGSSDAAAALSGAAYLWGEDAKGDVTVSVAQKLGADVAFFLYGGCALFEGAGDVFVKHLSPSNSSIAIVKPDQGVSTSAAYATFDDSPTYIDEEAADKVAQSERAQDVALYNNLAAASEAVLPRLADIRAWLQSLPGVEGVLLCGSGSATFALCESFSAACDVVTKARETGLWSRTASLSSLGAFVQPAKG